MNFIHQDLSPEAGPGEGALEGKEIKSALRAILWKVVGAFLILSIFGTVIYFSSDLNSADIVGSLEKLTLPTLMTSLALGMLQVVFQAARLWILLPNKLEIRFINCFQIFIGGQVVNQLLPARAGDLLKVNWLKSAGNRTPSERVRASEILGSVFIADKAIDVLALMICISLLAPSWLSELGGSERFLTLLHLELEEVFLGIGGVSVLFLFLWKTFGNRLKSVLDGLFQGASQVLEPKRFFLALGLAIGAWLTEAWILRQLTQALSYPLAIPQAILALGILNIGIAVPVSFANMGAFEGALAFGLSRSEIPLTVAIAVGATYHAIQILAVILPACGFLFKKRWWKTPIQSEPSLGRRFSVLERDKNRAIRYYEARSANYSDSVAHGPLYWLRQRESRAVLSFLNLENSGGLTFLDVGCGDGKYSLLAKSAGLKVSAMDICPGMISRLCGKVDRTWVDDIESYSPSATYDLVLCSGVLDFVLDPPSAFEKLCKSVAPGGRLVILVPFRGVSGLLYRFEKGISGFRVNLFSREELELWAKTHGLRLIGSTRPLPTNLVMGFERPSLVRSPKELARSDSR